MGILLHACCGPCSTVVLDELLKTGDEVSVFFYNPNIHPKSEYDLRLKTLKKYAFEKEIDVIEDEYIPNRWIDVIGKTTKHCEERCRKCYRLRLEKTAKYASENNFDAIATSLTISPYQFTDAINEELGFAAKKYGVVSLEADYRNRYKDSIEMSRALGMYRQNYCGCMYSMVEAAEQRTRQRAERKAAKASSKLDFNGDCENIRRA